MESACARGTKRLRHLRPGLQTSWCHRFSRPPLRLTRFAQRPSDVVSLGTARVLGQLHDRARRRTGKTRTALAARRLRWNLRGESVCAGAADCSIHLPREEIRFLDRPLAAREALAVIRPLGKRVCVRICAVPAGLTCLPHFHPALPCRAFTCWRPSTLLRAGFRGWSLGDFVPPFSRRFSSHAPTKALPLPHLPRGL